MAETKPEKPAQNSKSKKGWYNLKNKEKKKKVKKEKDNFYYLKEHPITIMFFVGIVLLFAGVVLDLRPLTPTETILYFVKRDTFFKVLVQMMLGAGTALIISGTFSIIMGTHSFLSFINKKLINKITSNEFIDALTDKRKKELIHEIIKPPVEMSQIYKPTEDYFNSFIENGLKMFDAPYRSDLNMDVVCGFHEKKGVLYAKSKIRYRTYIFKGVHAPFQTGLENEKSKFKDVVFLSNSGDCIVGKFDEVKRDNPKLDANLKQDQSLVKFGICNVPEPLEKENSFQIERSAIEYGNDHWLQFIYKNYSPINSIRIKIDCKKGFIIKSVIPFAKTAKLTIGDFPARHIEISCTGWVEPGFGLSVIIAKGNVKEEKEKLGTVKEKAVEEAANEGVNSSDSIPETDVKYEGAIENKC